MTLLEYSKWENFHKVIKTSMIACSTSNNDVMEHFHEVMKVLKVGNNAKMNIKDYKLSRYTCYLIAQNGDPRKEVIALAQTYFAIQTKGNRKLKEDEFIHE